MEETSASLAGIAPTASGEYPGPAHYPVLRDVARTLRDVARPLGASDRAEQLIGDIDEQITVMRSRRDVGAAGREHGSLGGASAQRPVPAGTREGRPVPEPATVRSGRVVILSSSGSPAAAAWKLRRLLAQLETTFVGWRRVPSSPAAPRRSPTAAAFESL
jgi:hypothetical protein